MKKRGRAGFRPTGRGIGLLSAAALIALAGLLFARVELVYLSIALALALGLSWLGVAVVRLPRPIERHADRAVLPVGDQARIVTLPDTRATFDDAHEQLSPALDLVASTRDEDGLTTVVAPNRRGVHSVGPLRLERLAPFASAVRRRRAGGAIELLAVPPLVPLASLRSSGSIGDNNAARPGPQGQGSDNLIPRPYAPGDSMRRVHWRASAHHGDLMVREEEREQTARASVMIDIDGRIWRDEDAFDRALSAFVSITARLVRDGYLVSVAAGSLRDEIATGADLDRLLAECARIEAVPAAREVAPRSDGGIAVAIGRATAPPATAAAHYLLASDVRGVSSPAGWRTTILGADVAQSWREAITGGAR